ncbi:hypothetical protein RJ641_026687 [Dillenia turbinata]|uniref:Uncharacterized protein n=1 Tax=Dillenia turbinata TaxID=194707 RepID=A0AAN8ZPI2_9MAGN
MDQQSHIHTTIWHAFTIARGVMRKLECTTWHLLRKAISLMNLYWLTMALGHIYVQLGQTEKALELLRKATRIDLCDAQAFLELGELLISSEEGAALDAFKNAHGLLKKEGEEVLMELLHSIGLAEQFFREALGDGLWLAFIDGKVHSYPVDALPQLMHTRTCSYFISSRRMVNLWSSPGTK